MRSPNLPTKISGEQLFNKLKEEFPLLSTSTLMEAERRAGIQRVESRYFTEEQGEAIAQILRTQPTTVKHGYLVFEES